MPKYCVTLATGARVIVEADSEDAAAEAVVNRHHGQLAFAVKQRRHPTGTYYRPYRHLPGGRRSSCGGAVYVSPERSKKP